MTNYKHDIAYLHWNYVFTPNQLITVGVKFIVETDEFYCIYLYFVLRASRHCYEIWINFDIQKFIKLDISQNRY